MTPGPGYRALRRATQAAVLLAVIGAPLLGGWQRRERNELAAWNGAGWDLPAPVLEALPAGEAPGRAYAANQLLGGGSAMALGGIAAIDPVAGLPALISAPTSVAVVLAWLLPLALALVVGRGFCGWLCPFGTLARALERLLGWLPWRPRRLRLPRRRPLRWIALGGTVVAAFLGAQVVLFSLLPHVLLQMSAYSLWLLGGGGALLGWLVALLVVGQVFGPTTFCAALCPTGAALSLPARKRLLRVSITEPASCGARCDLCTRSCWLQLDPASGDPGPDCDLCTRCFAACPRANLKVGRAGKAAPAKWGALALLLLGGVAPRPAEARPLPRLLLAAEHRVDDVHLAVEVVDHHGTRLDADDPRRETGVEITVYLARGPLGAADERGRLAERAVYAGLLTLEALGPAGDVIARADIRRANAPRSAPRRRLYRAHFDVRLEPGGAVRVAAIDGWLPEAVVRTIPASPGAGVGRFGRGLVVGLLVFGGLLALAAAWPDGDRRIEEARRRAGERAPGAGRSLGAGR